MDGDAVNNTPANLDNVGAMMLGRSGAAEAPPDEPHYMLAGYRCYQCRRGSFWLREVEWLDSGDEIGQHRRVKWTKLVFPPFRTTLIDPAVPARFADVFREAANVLESSPKASAALSRRCLQDLIREQAKIQKPTLDAEIGELLKSNTLPQPLAEDLDAIRSVGNLAAHPIKDQNTGQIVEVEPGEAEWNLEVLKGLLDFYFVQHTASQQRRAALNAKLQAAGKPPLKKP